MRKNMESGFGDEYLHQEVCMKSEQHSSQGSDLPKGLSQPAIRALTGAGYTRLEQLAGVSEAQLKQLHGMGPKGIKLLRAALEERGLSFVGG
jgi:hypothetical protein